MRLLRPALLACCLAVTLTPAQAQSRRHKAAADTPAATQKNPDKIFPFGTTWILTSFNGKAPGGEAPSFTLDDKLRATGFGGCNSFSLALYPIREQKLAAGAIATTHRTCDAATTVAERNFLVGLHSLPKWDVSLDGQLTLKGATGVMVFKRGV